MAYLPTEFPLLQDRRDRLPFQGLPFFISRPLNGALNLGSGEGALLLRKNTGSRQVHLITKLMFAGTSDVFSPQGDSVEIRFYNTPVTGGVAFAKLEFYLPTTTAGSGALATSLNNHFIWEPRHPILLNPDWRIEAYSTATLKPVILSMFGVCVDEHEVFALGGLPEFGNFLANGSMFDQNGVSIFTQLIPPSSGYSVELTDVVVELDPTADGAMVELRQATGPTDSGDVIFRWHHSYTNGTITRSKIRPRIFTDDDHGLYYTAENAAIGRGTINVIGRYVKNEDKPGNAWWSFVDSSLPSTSVVRGQFLDRSLDAIATFETGRQHYIEGYHGSLVNDSTGGSVLCGIATGSSASTSFYGNSGAALQPVSPLIGMTEPYEVQWVTVDEVAMPLIMSSGWTTFVQLDDSYPAASSDLTDTGFTIWGRTIEQQLKQSPDTVAIQDAGGIWNGG